MYNPELFPESKYDMKRILYHCPVLRLMHSFIIQSTQHVMQMFFFQPCLMWFTKKWDTKVLPFDVVTGGEREA